MQLTRKGWIGGIVAVVLVALGVYGWWTFLGPGSNPYRGLRTTSEVQMTDEIRTLIEQRVAVTEASIKAQDEENIDLDLYILLANDASMLGDLVKAREAAEKAVEGNSINYAAWNLLGSITEDMTDYDAARHAYKQAVVQRPGIDELYRDYVTLLENHWPDEREEIKATLEASVIDGDRSAWNMTALARWYKEEGDCTRARDHYELAKELDPENGELAAEASAAVAECSAK